jgi:hypothetical protein
MTNRSGYGPPSINSVERASGTKAAAILLELISRRVRRCRKRLATGPAALAVALASSGPLSERAPIPRANTGVSKRAALPFDGRASGCRSVAHNLSLLPNIARLGGFERQPECRAAALLGSTCRRQAGWRLFLPVTTISTSRPPQREQTNRSRQSRRGVVAVPTSYLGGIGLVDVGSPCTIRSTGRRRQHADRPVRAHISPRLEPGSQPF